jgi:hypothetical protein
MDGFNVEYSMSEWMNDLMCQIILMNMTYNNGGNVLVGNPKFEL